MKRSIWISLCLLGFIMVVSLMGCAGARQGKSEMQARSQRVQATLTDLVRALENYKDEKGFFPKGLAILRDGHYLSVMPDLEREWTLNYYVDGGKVAMVEAISKPEMPDGVGHKIVYRPQDQVWEGYGITYFNKKLKDKE
jgi:hypothetical protein